MNIKRTYYIFKCRTHVLASHCIERVLHTLSKWGLIVEHKKNYSMILDENKPQSLPDITSERFVYNLSYITRKIGFTDEYWFETKKGKVIYTMWVNQHEERRLSFRAELKSFYAHFSHKHREWVHRNSPRVLLCTESVDRLRFNHHTCDFSKCRFAFEISLAPDTVINSPSEVLSESYRVIKSGLTDKVPEINKMLTGAENDGQITSPSGCPLVDNLVCRECGYPVFAVPDGAYVYECIHHKRVNYQSVDKVDPKTYETILSNCLEEIEHFCECPQD